MEQNHGYEVDDQVSQTVSLCRGCGMPIRIEEDMGTEADGSKNMSYCIHCYRRGILVADEREES